MAVALIEDRLAGVNVFQVELAFREAERPIDPDPVPRLQSEAAEEVAGVSSKLEETISQSVERQSTHLLTVNLGSGKPWRTTRLYFLAALAAYYTEISAFVFVADRGTARGCFIGIATPRAVRRGLGEKRPAKDAGKESISEQSLRDCLGPELESAPPVMRRPGPETALLAWQILDRSTPFVAVINQNLDTEREVERLTIIDRRSLGVRIAQEELRHKREGAVTLTAS